MDKKGILELKRRMTKDGCTFTKMTGCYVDGEKNKIVNIDENFLGLEEEEFYKYLEIAKKTLSGTIGNNLMEYEFPLAEEEPGGHQQSLMAIKSSQLKNEEMLESFYDMVIENYEHTGNYLILLFHDVYDVMTKTTDNNKLDESEEIFEYIICSICPVALSKPGLGYRKDENRIGTVDRDWIVGLPESGFLFPAFTDRSTDIHNVMFYSKDAKEPHKELVNNILGCESKHTNAEKQVIFNNLLLEHVPEDDHKEVLIKVNENLADVIEEKPEEKLTEEVVAQVITESGVMGSVAQSIAEEFVHTLGEELPEPENIVDQKIVKQSAEKKEKIELTAKVEELTAKLEEANETIANSTINNDEEETQETDDNEIFVRVSGDKKDEIRTQLIEGQKCIVIPVSEEDNINIVKR